MPGDRPVIRVLVAAEVRLYRDGLAAALAHAPRLDVVATAATARECLARVAAEQPQVVLLETAMPEGLAAVRELAAAGSVRVVALSVPERVDDVLACAEAGVAGFVTREAGLDELVETIEAAVRDELVTSPRMAAALLRRVRELATGLDPGAGPQLTLREREILDLIDAGLSNKQIALELSIQLSTVKNHVHNILEKLQVERRAEAAAVVHGRTRSRPDGPASAPSG